MSLDYGKARMNPINLPSSLTPSLSRAQGAKIVAIFLWGKSTKSNLIASGSPGEVTAMSRRVRKRELLGKWLKGPSPQFLMSFSSHSQALLTFLGLSLNFGYALCHGIGMSEHGQGQKISSGSRGDSEKVWACRADVPQSNPHELPPQF